MTLEVSELNKKALQDTKRFDEIDEFRINLAKAELEISRVVREVLGPEQAIGTTLTELRDLYFSTLSYESALSAVNYKEERRAFFCQAIRLLDTANLWFSEQSKAGAYRPRSVDAVLQASRPWREKIKVIGEHAFVFEPELAELFADVNSSGTLEEEKTDLIELNSYIKQHREQLKNYGLTQELISEGEGLQNEAEGRDFLGILGLRSQEEAITLRNRILTYAVSLGREARAAGVNGCTQHNNEEGKRRFEAASFRNTLRRLRPKRRAQEDAATNALPEPPTT
jgi:hypothetical protein